MSKINDINPDLKALIRSLDGLVPDPANAREHGERDISGIARSLEEFGQQKPIVVRPDGSTIAGAGTIVAARRLGWTQIAAVTWDRDAKKMVGYAVADNRTAELSEWSEAGLRAAIAAVEEAGLSIEDVGFTEAELEDILGPVAGATPKEDEAPPLPKVAVTQPGDIWDCGGHVVICGDTVAGAVRAVIAAAGAEPKLCWTDPPWNVAYGEAKHWSRFKHREIANDALGDQFPAFAKGFCDAIAGVLPPGAPIYMAMSAQEWPVIDGALRGSGFHWSSTIIWAKDSLVLSRKDYHTQYEPIWYGWLAGAARLCEVRDRTQSDVWQFDRPRNSEEHPTMKPVGLVTRALVNSSRRGELVLDPFGGSGTTLIAAEQSERHAALVELDPRYVDVIVERWQNLTGGKATRRLAA